MTDRAATEANRTLTGMVRSLISLSLPDFKAVRHVHPASDGGARHGGA
jgi:hypothetical protein